MSAAVVVLAVVVVLDCALSGFRAAQGRTGRLPSRARDVRSMGAGLLVGALLVGGPVALGVGVTSSADRLDIAAAGLLGSAWLAAPTAVALVVFLVLPWRWRYLAMAVILGPMTLLRPVAAVLAGWLSAWASPGAVCALAVGLVTVGLLSVEPVVGLWHRRGVHKGAF